jgi:hypothetical protein
MGGEVVLEVAARVVKRHVVLLEQGVDLKSRLQFKESSDLTFGQCPRPVPFNRDGLKRPPGNVVPLLRQGG